MTDPDRFSSDLLNLFLPTRYQFVAPEAATRISDHFSGLFHEATAYVGLPLLLILTVVAARRWNDMRIRVATLVGAAMFLLSLGPYLHVGGDSTRWPLPWLPFTQVPLLEHVVPGRFTVFLWLAVAVVVAIVIDNAMQLPRRRAGPRLVAIAVALAVIVPAPLTSSTTAIPTFFVRWDQEGMRPDATVMIAPFFRDGAGADPMLWAAAAGDAVRMPEAYAYVPGANRTASYGPPATQLSTIMETIQDRGSVLVARGDVRDQVAHDLEAKGITDVIVGPMSQRAPMVAFFTDLFGRPPKRSMGWRSGVMSTEPGSLPAHESEPRLWSGGPDSAADRDPIPVAHQRNRPVIPSSYRRERGRRVAVHLEVGEEHPRCAGLGSEVADDGPVEVKVGHRGRTGAEGNLA